MNIQYSIVSLDNTVGTLIYKDILEKSLLIFQRNLEEIDYFSKSRNIEEVNLFVNKNHGKYLPGGRTVLFTIKFHVSTVKKPLILKVYNKISPMQLINHILSVDLFNIEFNNGIRVKNSLYYIIPSKNLLVSYSPELKILILIQEFSQGSIPDSLIPLSSICKVIGKKGYVIDFFAKNWRLQLNDDKELIKLNYIDILLSNKIFDEKGVKKLNQKLNSNFYSLDLQF
ncbi:MAG: hypothetical protein ACW981_12800 [Candidatus Hodarchaeales archaeon]|jgi:hypothetical protein